MPWSSLLKPLLFFGLFAFLLYQGPLSADPCYPSDPTGVNQDNLCLRYPPFPPGAPVTQGHGFNADYSRYGQYPPNRNRPVGTTGFWTGISVDGNSGSMTIQDSTGQMNTFTPRPR